MRVANKRRSCRSHTQEEYLLQASQVRLALWTVGGRRMTGGSLLLDLISSLR